ncbi:TlpA family protein disulfide reductase [Flagellimonas lutimaris]|uniref:TlpA family protein disulfide reductase n=1 Tax=Flagellimonas lutimaris TaxID=475082 RepID=UPI003F5CF926
MKQLRTYSLLFIFSIFLLFLISCGEKQKKSGDENLVQIKLKLENFDPLEHKSFIDLTVENATQPINQQLKVSDSGTVNVNFITTTKKEINFNYDGRNFNLIVSPNENIVINVEINELLDWSRFKQFEVDGVNSETNTLLMAHSHYMDSLIQSATTAGAKDGTYSEPEYKSVRLGEMEEQLKFFKKLISDKNITDNTFIDWGTAKIHYSAGTDLLLYPFYNPTNKEIDDNNEYFDFISKFQNKHTSEIAYLSYLNYLKYLAMSYVIIGNISNTYKVERSKLPKGPTANFPIAFEMIKRLPETKDREYVMTYAYYHNDRGTPEKYRDSLNKYVGSDILERVEMTEDNENLNIRNLLKNYDISDKEKKELLDLYANTSDKVIFHDFWFATCYPCMFEFPYYNDLISSNNEEEVVFIFYGVYMDKSEWKKTIEKYELKGVHHLLSKDQLAFFQKYFGVKGFPHHQLVNAEGNIVKGKIPGIRADNLENINSYISKHKKESE